MGGYVGIQGALIYTALEYIESTGTQYIDTGITGGTVGTYEIKLNTLGTSTSAYEQYFAGKKTSPAIPKLYLNQTNVITNIASLYANTDSIHTVEVKNDGVYLDGTKNSTTSPGSWEVSFYLFSAHEENSLKSTMRLYYCKMWKDGVLVRDYLPCLDNNNVACLYDKVSKQFFYNQGTGDFVASSQQTPVYTGFATIKKAYVGVNGVARKITKGYVGVNGVARKIFPGSLTFTTSQIGTISYPRYGGMASTTDYVVHAGGHNSGNTMSNTTEFFDANGTKTTGSALNTKRILLGAATFNDRAFFCGGSTSSSWNTSSTVEYFNNSKVRSTGTSLSASTYGSQAIANGLSYLMVCGGNVGNPLTDMVNFFNTSLTRTTNTLTTAVKAHSVGQINGYAIVAGGADNSAAKATAQSFDTNGTKTNLAALPVAKAGAALASTEKYFFMLGGSSVSATGTGNTTVYVYDKNLVLTSAPDLSAATRNVSGSDYNKEYAIVPTTTTIIDIYDSNLTRSSISALGYSYEWGGYGRNASSIPNAMIYNNDSGTVFMVKGE